MLVKESHGKTSVIDNIEQNYISVDQEACIDELEEIVLQNGDKDVTLCSPEMHTSYRSLLGMINWLQSRTQYHVCYRFSRSASASASPTIGDVKTLNK